MFDVVINPSFLPENIKLEKKVILEEIKMVKDNPADDIFNYFYKIIFNGHPLSFSILGSTKSLKALNETAISHYYKKNFNPDGIVLAAAGNVNHGALVDMVINNFEGILTEKNHSVAAHPICKPDYKRRKKIYKSKTEACHICIGGPGCSRVSRDKYPLSLFTNILGGSMSSRLFQKIREEKGLSYAIFASNTQYTDGGVTVIYAATSTQNVSRVMDLIYKEIAMLKKTGIPAEELAIAKENIKGNIVLGVEDISSRMFRLGKALLVDSDVLTIDEILKRIDNVTVKQVNEVISKYFREEDLSSVIISKPSNGRLK
ncbi:MAG: insulinase family protein [Actinobacteria bacterium]|nr:insulinase family protein [Actinomycetota bacterium]